MFSGIGNVKLIIYTILAEKIQIKASVADCDETPGVLSSLTEDSDFELNEAKTSNIPEESLPYCGKLAEINLIDVIDDLDRDEESPSKSIRSDLVDRLINDLSKQVCI